MTETARRKKTSIKTVNEPSENLSIKDLEATLSKLEAEKSRRVAERRAQGKMICLHVITVDGEDATEKKRKIHAEHMRHHPEDVGKGVDWIELVIMTGVSRDENWGRAWPEAQSYEPRRNTCEVLPSPVEEVGAPEGPPIVPQTLFWVETAPCTENNPGGSIEQAL